MIVTALSSWEPPPTASLSLNADVNTGVTSAAMDMDGATAEATPTTTTPYAGVELGGNVEPIYRAREYQLEMLEASMKENIIVAVRPVPFVCVAKHCKAVQNRIGIWQILLS